jgi:hypothetical protein
MLSPRTTIWENNPLAPGTGLMMAKCAFDRDAIPILPTQATQMLKKRGLHRSGAVPFFLPEVASVAFLRPLEPWLSLNLLGGQYLVLARKPSRHEKRYTAENI